MYAAGADEDELNMARGAANNLVTSSAHIRSLISTIPTR
jgi:hypothetical protein